MGNKLSSSKLKPAVLKPKTRNDTTAPRNQETTTQELSSNLSGGLKASNEGTSPDIFSELRGALKAHREGNYFVPTYGTISAATARSPASQQERCYDPRDPTLTFVDGEDDMDFELNEYTSLRAKMSCGHTVTPTSLMNWCKRLLEEGETSFVCGVCDAEWSCGEVYKMALMTPEEIDLFDGTLFKNVVPDLLGAKKCPGCKSLVVRKNLNKVRVRCTVCTANKGRCYEFCWQCLKEWKHSSKYPDHCAGEGCINQSLEILKTCKEIQFYNVKDVTGCPCVRACPTCGLLIAHNRDKCKNIVCYRCKVEFCFVCLRLTQECQRLMPGSFCSPCAGGVTPRQTSIPVWKQN